MKQKTMKKLCAFALFFAAGTLFSALALPARAPAGAAEFDPSGYLLERTADVAYGKVYRYVKEDGSCEVYVAKDKTGKTLSVTRSDRAPDMEEAPRPSLSVTTKQTDVYGNAADVTLDLTNGVYTLADPLRNIYVYHAHNGTGQFPTDDMRYHNSTGVFDDAIAVTSYLNLVKVYDFYADGGVGVPLKGVDGSHDDLPGNYQQNDESRIFLFVHYGVNEQNAHGWYDKWYNAAMVGVGDGNPDAYFYQLGRATDVMAHEYQHTITHFLVDFVQMNESGAIDEAISDILGALAEGHDFSDERFWKMGEDAVAKDDRAVRSMKDPANGYRSSFDDLFPACHEKHNHNTEGCDFGGVHYNSTVLTHAQYKMWEEAPQLFTKQRIGELWYSVIPLLSKDATFEEFKTALVQTAENLGFERAALNVMRKHLGMEGENVYTVTFRNADGALLYQTTVKEGETAVYAGDLPALPSTEQYDFSFEGWDKPLENITQDVEFTAKYTKTTRSYLVLFLDENGVTLKQEWVEYGGTATPPEPPAKPSDKRFSYRFSGWSGDYANVTGERSVVATYEAVKNRYAVRLHSDGALLSEKEYEYGEVLVLPSPEKEGAAFGGWYFDEACTNRAENVSVEGETDLYAKWTEVPAGTGCGGELSLSSLVFLCALPLLLKKKGK